MHIHDGDEKELSGIHFSDKNVLTVSFLLFCMVSDTGISNTNLFLFHSFSDRKFIGTHFSKKDHFLFKCIPRIPF